jgi:hypothetical protein
MTQTALTTRDLITAMNTNWVTLSEAFGIDVLAISQSRGQTPPHYRRISYELKASRADFRRELDAWPTKARKALEMAHAFVFVTPAGLLSDVERRRRHAPGRQLEHLTEIPSRPPRGQREALYVPEPCGLMEVGPDGVCKMRVRPKWGERADPWSAADLAYLAAYAWRPGVIMTAEYAKDQARYAKDDLERRLQRIAEEEERLRRVLSTYAPIHVQVGQHWRIPGGNAPAQRIEGPVTEDYRHAADPGYFMRRYTDGPVDVEILAILPPPNHAHLWGGRAKLRRLDTGEQHDLDRGYYSEGTDIGWVLTHGERIDRTTPATITDLASRRR